MITKSILSQVAVFLVYFDMKPYLKGSSFKDLMDESYFRLVRPVHHGIMWPNEQDFSSDTIVWNIQNGNGKLENWGNLDL